MKAFLVRLNGKRVCKAGIGPHGVLNAIVNWVGGGSPHTLKGELFLHVGGLDSRTDEHLRYAVPKLKVGDTVTVKIIEADRVDPEARRFKSERPKKSRMPRRAAARRGSRSGKQRS
jgi:hypothetical protein